MLNKFLTMLLLATSGAASAATPQPYTLDQTEVRAIHAQALQRDYELFVSLPAGYATSARSYPVLFVTDANYAFPLIRSIARRAGNGGKDIDDFILVGLSYAKGDTPEYSRRRDYTPSGFGQAMTSDMPGREARFGEAEGYRRFIAAEVFPFIAKTYRADMRRKIYAGHSYGSLLGLHMLLTEPSMFQHYILGSPSLWFNNHVMFARERDYAASHKDLPAKVYLAIGSDETIKPASTDPRHANEHDMLRDLRKFTRTLESRRYPGLQVQSKVIADEDHLTVAPAILTRGLMWALKPAPAPLKTGRPPAPAH
ncbi:alpha/beta hydrolase [Janthinobacterium agaricidamnosum]|uniref:Esterase family protein n=1 Tax=Janthinobacterium agaricidamnosum NBRC 102515 = DSM 9628 TaxID=1349767 RepID=W0V5Q3_9BURK|nr:alpha/beta hydrolase-fold protein [Janthinobacterium agaricidamnosum]CDG82683.1 esterase family protein [Janthinobacterium agaricidamnosum NBRC 102515 = DSM 9628]